MLPRPGLGRWPQSNPSGPENGPKGARKGGPNGYDAGMARGRRSHNGLLRPAAWPQRRHIAGSVLSTIGAGPSSCRRFLCTEWLLVRGCVTEEFVLPRELRLVASKRCAVGPMRGLRRLRRLVPEVRGLRLRVLRSSCLLCGRAGRPPIGQGPAPRACARFGSRTPRVLGVPHTTRRPLYVARGRRIGCEGATDRLPHGPAPLRDR